MNQELEVIRNITNKLESIWNTVHKLHFSLEPIEQVEQSLLTKENIDVMKEYVESISDQSLTLDIQAFKSETIYDYGLSQISVVPNINDKYLLKLFNIIKYGNLKIILDDSYESLEYKRVFNKLLYSFVDTNRNFYLSQLDTKGLEVFKNLLVAIENELAIAEKKFIVVDDCYNFIKNKLGLDIE